MLYGICVHVQKIWKTVILSVLGGQNLFQIWSPSCLSGSLMRSCRITVLTEIWQWQATCCMRRIMDTSSVRGSLTRHTGQVYTDHWEKIDHKQQRSRCINLCWNVGRQNISLFQIMWHLPKQNYMPLCYWRNPVFLLMMGCSDFLKVNSQRWTLVANRVQGKKKSTETQTGIVS